MSSYARILLTSPLTSAQLSSVLNLAPGQLPALQNLENYLSGFSGGNQMALLEVDVNPVYAYGLLTSTGSAVAAETFTLCNVVFTARNSGATGNEFNVSGTVAIQAANIAAAINASASLAGIVTASSLDGVVTITSALPGLIGNGLQLSENLTNVSATAFAHGTDGTTYDLDFR
jgi:hypothetical protein